MISRLGMSLLVWAFALPPVLGLARPAPKADWDRFIESYYAESVCAHGDRATPTSSVAQKKVLFRALKTGVLEQSPESYLDALERRLRKPPTYGFYGGSCLPSVPEILSARRASDVDIKSWLDHLKARWLKADGVAKFTLGQIFDYSAGDSPRDRHIQWKSRAAAAPLILGFTRTFTAQDLSNGNPQTSYDLETLLHYAGILNDGVTISRVLSLLRWLSRNPELQLDPLGNPDFLGETAVEALTRVVSAWPDIAIVRRRTVLTQMACELPSRSALSDLPYTARSTLRDRLRAASRSEPREPFVCPGMDELLRRNGL